MMGRNRSACLAIAYAMLVKRWPLMPVVREVFQARPVILGNWWFRHQLCELAHESKLPFDGNIPSSDKDTQVFEPSTTASTTAGCSTPGEASTVADSSDDPPKLSVNGFAAGQRVEIRGLLGAPHLNGTIGVLNGRVQDGRLGVDLPPPDGTKALRPENLKAVL